MVGKIKLTLILIGDRNLSLKMLGRYVHGSVSASSSLAQGIRAMNKIFVSIHVNC